MISHQEKIISMADRIMVIDDGKIKAEGLREDVLPCLNGLDKCHTCAGKAGVSVMVELDHVVEEVLKVINDNGFSQKGAFNLRQNGTSICHGDSEHIKIKKKTDKPGIDIYIDGETKGEKVYIPVVVSVSGMTDLVYNDFYIADGADVTIVAGCGIHNSGCNESRHDGIHTFHVGKNANVCYQEKHYGEGNGTGGRVLNPVTNIYVGENSVFTLDTAQIKGVDSTVRETLVEMEKNARLYVTERLMTEGEQTAESNIEVRLNGGGELRTDHLQIRRKGKFRPDVPPEGGRQQQVPGAYPV